VNFHPTAGLPFEAILEDVSGGNRKVQKGDYLASGKFPIIDQGQQFIGGFTDSEDDLVQGEGPWIVFGDHTRALKYVDFPYHFLQAQELPDAGYSRHFKFLKRLQISLPPLDEQRRIAAILDKADALRRKRKRAIELLEDLKHSIFLEMFGAVDRFPTISVGQSLLQPFRNGLSPAKAGTFAGRVLTLSAITSGVFEPSAVKVAMFAAEPPINQRVSRGEFLICRGNGNRSLVGIGVFASCSMPDALFPDTIIAGKIDPDRFHPRYFQDVWNGNFVRSQIEKSARTTNGTFKVNQSGLEAISIPMPDISLQAAYGDKTASIEQAKSLAFTQQNFLDSLFSSLQHRAFSGQL
jgi:type I restriction enzyme, S subunit